MKKKIIKSLIAIIICLATLIPCAVNTYAEGEMFTVDVNVDTASGGSLKEGDAVNVVCTVKDIKVSEGIIGISFKMQYDKDVLAPVIVSAKKEDTTPYDDFMINVPQYTMVIGGNEVQAPAYENICSCVEDMGLYNLMFIDKVIYTGIKDGTTVDPTLRRDGDLVISVPFTVKSKEPVNKSALGIVITNITGTAGGETIRSVKGRVSGLDTSEPEESETEASTPTTKPAGTSNDDSSGKGGMLAIYALAGGLLIITVIITILFSKKSNDSKAKKG